MPTASRQCVARTHTFALRAHENAENASGTPLAFRQATAKTMLRLRQRQRDVLADKVPDMANIVAGAIVIGFAIGDPRASWPVLMAGLAFWGAALLFVLLIAEDR